jgi:hypothetical protein
MRALLVPLAVSVLLAQFSGSSPTTLSPTRADTAASYTGNAAAGAIAFQVANPGAKICAGVTGAFCLYMNLSLEILGTDGSFFIGAGQNMLMDAQYPRQDTIPFEHRGTKGYRHVPVSLATLGTCGTSAAPEGTEVTLSASSLSARTRKCICTSDGGSTPAYAWANLLTGTVGTSTACNL